MAEIVDAFEDNHVFDTRLGQNITIEAGERTDAECDIGVWIVKNAVTAVVSAIAGRASLTSPGSHALSFVNEQELHEMARQLRSDVC
ncbi:MAG: hypothetical protein ACR2IV_19010 [Bryobacteraceae bacterium]